MDKHYESRVHGKRHAKTINIFGRVQMDVLHIVLTDYDLGSYTLDYVSHHFLLDRKEDVPHSMITDLQVSLVKCFSAPIFSLSTKLSKSLRPKFFNCKYLQVCRKVTQKIAVLRRMRNMLPFELRKAIYNSFITPHYNYCAETWHFCSKSSLNKLEKVHGRAIRFVFKDKNTPYCDLLKQLGRVTLAEERAHKILGTIF